MPFSAQTVEQPGFGLCCGRFQVDDEDVVGEVRQEAGLHERRLAAPGRTVDEADGEGVVGVAFFDARLPKTDRVGQAVAVSGTGEKIQEEAGVVGIEGSQTLRDDLDRLAVGTAGSRSRDDGIETAHRVQAWRPVARRPVPAGSADAVDPLEPSTGAARTRDRAGRPPAAPESPACVCWSRVPPRSDVIEAFEVRTAGAPSPASSRSRGESLRRSRCRSNVAVRSRLQSLALRADDRDDVLIPCRARHD